MQFLRKSDLNVLTAIRTHPLCHFFHLLPLRTTNHQAPSTSGNYRSCTTPPVPPTPAPSALQSPSQVPPLSRTDPTSCLHSLALRSLHGPPGVQALRAALLPPRQGRSRHWSQTQKSWVWVSSPLLPNCVAVDNLFNLLEHPIFTLKMGRGSALPSSRDYSETLWAASMEKRT